MSPSMAFRASVVIFLVMLLSVILSPLVREYLYPTKATTNIAFVGNSFTFVNDLPRLIEALGNNNNNVGDVPMIYQDSILHGSLSFSSLLRYGNGMTKWWQTETARIPESSKEQNNYYMEEEYTETEEEEAILYDYGACTVTQLLVGYDPNLSENNNNEYYKNDGWNPCFQSEDYLAYSQHYHETTIQHQREGGARWDFVVMNDQSMCPAMLQKRNRSIYVLQQSYAPLLLEAGAIPVLYSTYGYWRTTGINMTESLDPYGEDGTPVTDVPIFTSRLYRGYQLCAQGLKEADLPEVRVAPVGLAFLTVWEENYNLWQRLFLSDEYHPTPLGTYLVGCTVYSTIFGEQAPPSTTSQSIEALFAQARRLQLNDDIVALPSVEEALYLRYIAKRVTLLGHVPKSLRIYKNNEEEEYDISRS